MYVHAFCSDIRYVDQMNLASKLYTFICCCYNNEQITHALGIILTNIQL